MHGWKLSRSWLIQVMAFQVMAPPVQPNPDALAAFTAPPAAPPVIPPAPAQPAPAANGGVVQAAQAAPVQQEEVCSWLVVFFPYSAYFSCYAVFSFSLVFHCQSSALFCTRCSFHFLSLAPVCRRLAPRFPFFLSSYVSSHAGSIVICISSCVLPNLVLCRPFDRLQRFAVHAIIISVSQCSAVTSFWPGVRLSRILGRGFGY